ncbi:MAG: hypothetical protein HYT76_02345 [Deltaproteobacteria bacterium]|nr:hypothetical protein [Deltaproteobacteria bacterium]
MPDGINEIKRMAQAGQRYAVDWEKVQEAQVLLGQLHPKNSTKATSLAGQLEDNPSVGNVDRIIREAEEALGLRKLTQASPERSGAVLGASRFRTTAVDRSPVRWQEACGSLGAMSEGDFQTMRLNAGDARVALYNPVEEGIKQALRG